jgi:acyl carrier protein
MTRAEILQEILTILKKYKGRGADRTALTEATSLADELDIDSARMVDIVLDLEGKFGITIDDSSLTKLRTIGDIADLVESVVKEQKGS